MHTFLISSTINEIVSSTNSKANIKVGALHNVYGDEGSIHQVVASFLSNAVKYSSKKENPLVEIYSNQENNGVTYTFKDNGAGFDMKYANKLFGVLQRLHSQKEFEGTGIGLALVL